MIYNVNKCKAYLNLYCAIIIKMVEIVNLNHFVINHHIFLILNILIKIYRFFIIIIIINAIYFVHLFLMDIENKGYMIKANIIYFIINDNLINIFIIIDNLIIVILYILTFKSSRSHY